MILFKEVGVLWIHAKLYIESQFRRIVPRWRDVNKLMQPMNFPVRILWDFCLFIQASYQVTSSSFLPLPSQNLRPHSQGAITARLNSSKELVTTGDWSPFNCTVQPLSAYSISSPDEFAYQAKEESAASNSLLQEASPHSSVNTTQLTPRFRKDADRSYCFFPNSILAYKVSGRLPPFLPRSQPQTG